MTTKHTSATPAGVVRSRSRLTRATRKYLIAHCDFSRKPTVEKQMQYEAENFVSDLHAAQRRFHEAMNSWPKESPNA